VSGLLSNHRRRPPAKIGKWCRFWRTLRWPVPAEWCRKSRTSGAQTRERSQPCPARPWTRSP